jgi:D-alanyl-lipoteichoic acid acyltransferase DltB (MBOAT superfamily)
MAFPTLTFALFFSGVILISWLLMPMPKYWKPFIILASLVFYGWADIRFVGLLVFMVLANQFAAIRIFRVRHNHRAKTVALATIIIIDLLVLGVFKYFNFFIDSFNALFGNFGGDSNLLALRIILPIGISFYTFQSISYVMDVYREQMLPASFLDFSVFLTFFPQLVAGPIVRPAEFIPQLQSPRNPREIPLSPALVLIASGLIKKVVIADQLGRLSVDQVFGAPSAYSTWDILIAVLAFGVQIYCDFSGYTDMAIGIAMLLGFRFPQNFDRPYRAASLQEFWRRWHMTLSRFLRDYLYVGLGGNKKGERRTTINLIATMTIGGFWHGASVTFIVWGLLHGIGLAVERYLRLNYKFRLPYFISVAITFIFVNLVWIFFRSESITDALSMFSELFTSINQATITVTPLVIFLIAIGLFGQYLPSRLTQRSNDLIGAIPVPLAAIGVGIATALVMLLTSGTGVSPFIYFQF